MAMKYGCATVLSPALEHPLQDLTADSPSPIKPLHTGSTNALYSSSLQVSSTLLNWNNLINFWLFGDILDAQQSPVFV